MSSDNIQKAGDQTPAFFDRPDPPLHELFLWPNRSLGRQGYKTLMTLVGVGLLFPVIPFLFTPLGPWLLPFVGVTYLGLWYLLRRNYRDGRMHEHLRLWPDLILVERHEKNGEIKRWQANPYWVEPYMKNTRTHENYVTLRGGGREIELGAFLSPEERADLYRDVLKILSDARKAKN